MSYLAAMALLAVACDSCPGCCRKSDEPVAPAAPPAVAPSAPQEALKKLALSPSNAKVGFTGAKLVGSHDGEFKSFEGEILHDGKNPAGAKVTVHVDMSSVATDNPQLDTHLKSPDFFDVAQFPKAKFESVSIAQKAGEVYLVKGHLAIHGVKMVVSFDAAIRLEKGRVFMNAEFPINRKAFGIVYPGMPDNLIKDEVVLRLSIDAPLN